MDKTLNIIFHTDENVIHRLTETMQCCVAAGGSDVKCDKVNGHLIVTCKIDHDNPDLLMNELCGCSKEIHRDCIILP